MLTGRLKVKCFIVFVICNNYISSTGINLLMYLISGKNYINLYKDHFLIHNLKYYQKPLLKSGFLKKPDLITTINACCVETYTTRIKHFKFRTQCKDSNSSNVLLKVMQNPEYFFKGLKIIFLQYIFLIVSKQAKSLIDWKIFICV